MGCEFGRDLGKWMAGEGVGERKKEMMQFN